eukprot:scaffold16006_cov70-Cyclotella_meneghiniana.AAC.2
MRGCGGGGQKHRQNFGGNWHSLGIQILFLTEDRALHPLNVIQAEILGSPSGYDIIYRFWPAMFLVLIVHRR